MTLKVYWQKLLCWKCLGQSPNKGTPKEHTSTFSVILPLWAYSGTKYPSVPITLVPTPVSPSSCHLARPKCPTSGAKSWVIKVLRRKLLVESTWHAVGTGQEAMLTSVSPGAYCLQLLSLLLDHKPGGIWMVWFFRARWSKAGCLWMSVQSMISPSSQTGW